VTVAQALLLVQAALFWWFVRSGHVGIVWVAALALFGGIVNAFEIPARQSFIIELVGREDLLDAIALNSTGFNLARIVGPMLAGVIIAKLGLAWCFGLNALSYLAVLAGLLAIRLPPRAGDAAPVTSPMAGLREGIAYLRRTREVWVLIRLVAVYAIFGVPYLALMPVIARDVLRGDARSYGLLLTSVGLGALVAALALAAVSRRVRRGQLLAWAALAFSVTLIMFSLSRALWLSAALLLAVGSSMIATNALANGLLQTLVPDALRGRVMSAYVWVFVGVGPVVGPYLAGALAKVIGAAGTVAAGAVVTLGYALWAFSRHPEIGRL
jgi:MFS family permease